MQRWLLAATLTVALVGGSYLLLHSGVYGLALFLAVPFFLGILVDIAFVPRTGPCAAGYGALAALVASGSLLVVGIEGLICIVMSLPITVTLGATGAFVSYEFRRQRVRAHGAAMLLLLPAGSLGFDLTARPPVFQVRTAIDIAAPPEKVWQSVVTFSDLPEPDQWYFRAGLAYPKRARIVGSGPGAVRYCEFSTGPFVEPIEVWDQPRLLRFRVAANPAPMHEWSPYARVIPKHLHGYLVSRQGQFLLTPLPSGGTHLEGTTWYQHGLWPAQYWRLWSDAIIHRIHLRVLEQI
jgi:hypothetical protein